MAGTVLRRRFSSMCFISGSGACGAGFRGFKLRGEGGAGGPATSAGLVQNGYGHPARSPGFDCMQSGLPRGYVKSSWPRLLLADFSVFCVLNRLLACAASYCFTVYSLMMAAIRPTATTSIAPSLMVMRSSNSRRSDLVASSALSVESRTAVAMASACGMETPAACSVLTNLRVSKVTAVMRASVALRQRGAARVADRRIMPPTRASCVQVARESRDCP